jgi:hypothetical protein
VHTVNFNRMVVCLKPHEGDPDAIIQFAREQNADYDVTGVEKFVVQLHRTNN